MNTDIDIEEMEDYFGKAGLEELFQAAIDDRIVIEGIRMTDEPPYLRFLSAIVCDIGGGTVEIY